MRRQIRPFAGGRFLHGRYHRRSGRKGQEARSRSSVSLYSSLPGLTRQSTDRPEGWTRGSKPAGDNEQNGKTMATFHFDLVSPEKLAFSGEVDQVDIPGIEGDFGVLAGHAPVIAAIRPGILTVTTGATRQKI